MQREVAWLVHLPDIFAALTRRLLQNAMCKAMGALFLQHRVQCLEREMESFNQVSSSRICKRSTASDDPHVHEGNSSNTKSQRPSCEQPTSKCPLSWGRGMLFRHSISRDESAEACAQFASVVYVADASVLIYSLRSIHDWLKDASVRIVVPAEAICSLDLVKKGCGRISVAARRATHFLEERFSSPLVDQKVCTPGLWPQKDSERLSIYDAERAKFASRTPRKESAVDSHEDGLLLKDAPVHIRESLLCALWQQQAVGGASSPVPFAYAVALSPPLDDRSARVANGSSTGNRVDGAAVIPWARAYGLKPSQNGEDGLTNLKVLPPSASWLRHSQNDADTQCVAHHPVAMTKVTHPCGSMPSTHKVTINH